MIAATLAAATAKYLYNIGLAVSAGHPITWDPFRRVLLEASLYLLVGIVAATLLVKNRAWMASVVFVVALAVSQMHIYGMTYLNFPDLLPNFGPVQVFRAALQWTLILGVGTLVWHFLWPRSPEEA